MGKQGVYSIGKQRFSMGKHGTRKPLPQSRACYLPTMSIGDSVPPLSVSGGAVAVYAPVTHLQPRTGVTRTLTVFFPSGGLCVRLRRLWGCRGGAMVSGVGVVPSVLTVAECLRRLWVQGFAGVRSGDGERGAIEHMYAHCVTMSHQKVKRKYNPRCNAFTATNSHITPLYG